MPSAKLLFFPCCLSLLAPVTLPLGGLSSCAHPRWESEEVQLGESREKSPLDTVLLCWEPPVEPYRDITNLTVYLSPEESRDTTSLANIVEFMIGKAAEKGANGLLMSHDRKKKLYDSTNSINILSFVQDAPGTNRKMLKGKAIWIEDIPSTHGSDEMNNGPVFFSE